MFVSFNSNGDDSPQIKLLNWIADIGINGFGFLPSAEQVADDHQSKTESVEDTIDSVILWRTTHAAGTDFVTGLGGIATLPITIPASMAASYALGQTPQPQLQSFEAMTFTRIKLGQ